VFTLLPSLPQIPRRPVERAASWFAWSRRGTMFLCQPTPDRPLPNAQPFGDGSCWNTCLLESEQRLESVLHQQAGGADVPEKKRGRARVATQLRPPLQSVVGSRLETT
jgi:hypothetical protein